MSIKRYLSALLSLLLLLSLVSCHQTGVKESPAEDFEYQVRDDGGIEITKYVGKSDHVIIPQTIDNKAVTAIGERSFAGASIVSLVMPDTVTYVLSYAFIGCDRLTTVKTSTSLTAVMYGAFINCSSLTGIDLSMDSMKFIDHEAFRGCQNLRTVEFGDNITVIRDKAFYDCASLEEAILPKNLEEIGEYAFMNGTNIKKIWIPKTLEKWGFYPFYTCSSVSEIVFEDGLKQIGGISNVFCYKGKMETLRIPASVEQIAEGAFTECVNLKEIYFDGAAPQIGTGQHVNFVTPEQDVKIYYHPSMSGWDTTPLKEVYTLVPLS